MKQTANKPSIRRVRQNEHELVKELCQNDDKWSHYYNNEGGHSKWLERALYDLEHSKDRVVIGAFISEISEGDYHIQKLIACIFLKKSHFEKSVELKNLVIAQNDFEEDVTKGLINKALHFCEIRNVNKVEVELPQDEHNLISLFLSLNFKIAAVRERYNPGTKVCILDATIGNNYREDPFDRKKFALWFLKQYLPYENVVVTSQNSVVQITFDSKIISPAFSKSCEAGYAKRLRGILTILDHSSDEEGEEDTEIDGYIENIIKASKECPIKILLVDYLSEDQQNKLVENNFIIFDSTEQKRVAGGDSSSKSIPFEAINVGGVITVLESKKVCELAFQDTTTYYLFSGIGVALNMFDQTDENDDSEIEEDDEYDYLDYDDDEYAEDEDDYEGINEDREDLIIAIYCPNWNGKFGIVGYFEVKDLEKESFEEILSKPIPLDSGLTRQDLEFYKIYSEEQRTIVAKCGKLHLFKQPIPIKNGKWASNNEINNFLYREIAINANNITYLDIDSRQNLKEIPTVDINQIPLLKNNPLMLETIAAVLGIVADSTAITDFTRKQIEEIREKFKHQKAVSVPISSLPRITQKIIEESKALLDEKVNYYYSIKKKKGFSDLERNEHCQTIAENILELLEGVETIKEHIPDYDVCLAIFIKVVQSR